MKLNRYIFLTAVLGASMLSGAAQATFPRTVVDTIQALVAINRSIDAENAPILRTIDFIQAEIRNDNSRLLLYNDSIAEATLLLSNLAPQVKSESVRVSAEVYFSKHIDKVPTDTLLAYCNPKEVNKARDSKDAQEKIRKILDKFREKEEKRVSKGDYRNGFLPNLVRTNLDRYTAQRAGINEGITQKTLEITKQKGLIVSKPNEFRLAQWKERMGEKELPTRRMSVPVTAGLDTLKYADLRSYYYSTPGMLQYCDTVMTVEGYFDGILKDRVTLFPYPGSNLGAGEDNGDGMTAYGSLVLLSERGTVAPGLFYLPDHEFRLGYEDSEAASDFSLKLLETNWGSDPERRDGIIVDLQNMNFDLLEDYTLAANDGDWTRQTPMDVSFFSYDKCVELINQQGKIPETNRYRVVEPIMGVDFTVTLMLASDELVGNPPVPGEKKLYIKSQPAILDMELPAAEFQKWFVSDNPWNSEQQVVVIINETGEGPRADVYNFSPNSEGLYTLNGREYTVGLWEKIGSGLFDTERGGFDLHPIE